MSYQTPRGTNDILPGEIEKWHAIEDVIRQFCMLYDYKEIRTPIFEDTKVFKRENDSSDMVNKEMYTFSINGRDSLTLRPEMTAGVVRSFVQHKMYGEGELPAKMYYIGPMFRYERPQKGRQRIFHQFGVEVTSDANTMTVCPGHFAGCTIDAAGDHRIAMAAAIGATVASGPVTILGADCVKKSYPNFWDEYKKLGGQYEQHIR